MEAGGREGFQSRQNSAEEKAMSSKREEEDFARSHAQRRDETGGHHAAAFRAQYGIEKRCKVIDRNLVPQASLHNSAFHSHAG